MLRVPAAKHKRREKHIKKLIALFLALVMALGLTACGGGGTSDDVMPGDALYDGTLRSLIPESKELGTGQGTWTETDGYSYLVLTGMIDWDAYIAYSQVLCKAGYLAEGSGGDRNLDADYFDFTIYGSETEYHLRTVLYSDNNGNDTMLIVVGEIPNAFSSISLPAHRRTS